MIRRIIATCLVLGLNAAAPVMAKERFDPFSTAAIEDRLGASIPRDLVLWDDAGQQVKLGDHLGKKPILLAPVDFDCRNICGVTLAGLLGALDLFDRKPSEAFELLIVSIDPSAGRAGAAAAKAEQRERFDVAAAAHFLTGDAAPLLDALGFRYAYDPDTDQYAHPAAVAVLTPDGRLARWLYGYPFEAFDLRLALSEAGESTVGSLTDRLWLLCFRYDPKLGTYTPVVLGALQAGGALTALLLGGGIVVALWREKRRRS
jgi:protein SCO1/2